MAKKIETPKYKELMRNKEAVKKMRFKIVKEKIEGAIFYIPDLCKKGKTWKQAFKEVLSKNTKIHEANEKIINKLERDNKIIRRMSIGLAGIGLRQFIKMYQEQQKK